MAKEVEATKNIEEKGMNEMKETNVKGNTKGEEKIVMNETTEIKGTTAKTEKAKKETKTDEKKTVKKSVETKKKATGKQVEVTGEKMEKGSTEQIPSAYVDETVKTDNTLPVIKDIEAVRGDVINHTPEEIDQFEELCRQIHKEQLSMQKSYLGIAIPIYNVYIKKWFDILGDADIYNFAKRVFGISKGRCSEFKKVVETFGLIDEDTKCCTGIKPEFQSYSVSQLIEMTKMTEDQQKLVSESIPVSAMKKLRLNGELPENTSESAPAPKPKRRNYQLFKGENLESYESLEKSLLSKLSEFTDQHEAVRNIKITLSYEE